MDEKMHWVLSAVVLDGLVIAMNIIELALLLKKWNRLDRIEHLLFSLCITDLMCGFCMFGQDVYQLNSMVKGNGFVLANDVAMILDCLVLFFILVSTFHVTAIAIERIVAVSMPLKYTLFTKYSCKVFTISFVWTFALLLAPGVTLLGYFTNKTHVVGQYLMAFLVATICMLVFVSYMLLTALLIRRQYAMKELLEPEMRKQMRDRRTTLFCLFFGCAFVVCMLPYAIGLFDKDLFHNFQILLLTAYHLLNPIIYFFKSSGDNTRSRRGTMVNSASNLITRETTMSNAGHSPSVRAQSFA